MSATTIGRVEDGARRSPQVIWTPPEPTGLEAFVPPILLTLTKPQQAFLCVGLSSVLLLLSGTFTAGSGTFTAGSSNAPSPPTPVMLTSYPSIHAGSVLEVLSNGPLFAADSHGPDKGQTIGQVSYGDLLEARGAPVTEDGKTLVPLTNGGSVEVSRVKVASESDHAGWHAGMLLEPALPDLPQGAPELPRAAPELPRAAPGFPIPDLPRAVPEVPGWQGAAPEAPRLDPAQDLQMNGQNAPSVGIKKGTQLEIVKDGPVFAVDEHGPSWGQETGEVFVGQLVQASGSPVNEDGHSLVPLEGGFSVELSMVRVAIDYRDGP